MGLKLQGLVNKRGEEVKFGPGYKIRYFQDTYALTIVSPSGEELIWKIRGEHNVDMPYLDLSIEMNYDSFEEFCQVLAILTGTRCIGVGRDPSKRTFEGEFR